MIKKITVNNYRILRSVAFCPNPRMNIVVGDNESGKSTLFEAMILALTGRINGRSAHEELNPFWFNQDAVEEYLEKRRANEPAAFPEINIEIFFEDRDELARLSGRNNSETVLAPGLTMRVVPDPDYREVLDEYFGEQDAQLVPVEYYRIEWVPFSDENPLFSKPKEVSVAVIDSRTIRSTSGVDYQMREILKNYLEKDDQIAISLAFRDLKTKMTNERLSSLNEKLAELDGVIQKENVTLEMDQGSQGAWDLSAIPHVASVPFSMSGLGQQVSIKTELALARSAAISTQIIIIEEPENHLSHTKLNKLLESIASATAENEQQVFVSTHSSYVMNRLGLESIVLAYEGSISEILTLPPETVSYFRKLSGYDTLRMVLAEKTVLVEGPSDEILFERFYKDKYNRRPIEDGVDVISMGGLSRKNCLTLAAKVEKKCALLTDNDGNSYGDIMAPLEDLLETNIRGLFVGEPDGGATLELQIIHSNGENVLREIFGVDRKSVV